MNKSNNKEVSQVQTIVTAASATKADKARVIFAESYAQDTVPQRKDIIARVINEAGLTKAGASTYLQNYKSKQGLTMSKKSTS